MPLSCPEIEKDRRGFRIGPDATRLRPPRRRFAPEVFPQLPREPPCAATGTPSSARAAISGSSMNHITNIQ
ncbi:hypothetical protein C7S16_4372 [Burkholderia thailandensis]|uniref:Uncharacterized protein n=1 Tax=Burkholderia thailandensis TaxID=57975 RepID=A0AAW9CI57_BURTH|nr:hypothetical protein [Burkholderia thailandensis]MDW9250615.1 hypothetical protein [Burkholderia thailandensis]